MDGVKRRELRGGTLGAISPFRGENQKGPGEKRTGLDVFILG